MAPIDYIVIYVAVFVGASALTYIIVRVRLRSVNQARAALILDKLEFGKRLPRELERYLAGLDSNLILIYRRSYIECPLPVGNVK